MEDVAVELSLFPGSSTEHRQTGPAASVVCRGRLLIVEDDAGAAEALCLLFERRGFDVVVAGTVAAGVAGLAWHPEYLVLDLNLPDGNGLTVLRQARAAGLATRIAITTGSNDTAELAEAEGLHPDALLHKPIDFQELLTVLAPS